MITSLGHAGLRIETPDLRLLADPWLSPGGAFLGSWFQLPDNSHLRTPQILDCDWVAVSHEHLDHLDLPLLASLPSQVRVVVPRYPSPILRTRLQEAGVRHVIELDAWERLPLNTSGDWMTVIPEQSPMCHDAAILVVASGRAIMHTNDARLSLTQARRAMAEVGGPLDFMAVQMSGASWHPICYEYPEDVTARICAEKRAGKFKAVTRLVRGAQPKVVMPYAGPPCFLDPDLMPHNRWIPEPGIFPDPAQAARWLDDRLPHQQSVTMLPGDTFDLGSGRVLSDPHWDGFAWDDLDGYLETYAERRAGELAAVHAAYPEPDPASALDERFAEHFRRLGSMSSYFLERIGLTLRFDVTGPAGGTWDVVLGQPSVAVHLTPRSRRAQYRLRLDSRWLDAVITGRARWEELFLSLRFSAWREPDVYNDYLVGLLKHADPSALEAVEAYESSRDPADTVVISADGGRWEVSRFCPHAGEDLEMGAVVSGGVLRCLAHNFDFDLATGQCLNARCEPIMATRVEAPAAARHADGLQGASGRA
jgi:L-ascorbate metabolism protein UlaG (beta-lactamase superfamily)/nitrite reductase/ring-hydroxylating ferredoxin subunit